MYVKTWLCLVSASLWSKSWFSSSSWSNSTTLSLNQSGRTWCMIKRLCKIQAHIVSLRIASTSFLSWIICWKHCKLWNCTLSKPMQFSRLIQIFTILVLKYFFSSLRLAVWPFLKAGTITADVENSELPSKYSFWLKYLSHCLTKLNCFVHCPAIPFWSKLSRYFSNTMMWTSADCLPTIPETLLKTWSSSTSLFNCMTHDLSIWKLDKDSSSVIHVTSWSIHSQLLSHCLYEPWKRYRYDFNTANSYTVINFIFKAIFIVKTKADICLYSPTCCYRFVFYFKVALLESSAIFGRIHSNVTWYIFVVLDIWV